jgi:hypothetical protein
MFQVGNLQVNEWWMKVTGQNDNDRDLDASAHVLSPALVGQSTSNAWSLSPCTTPFVHAGHLSVLDASAHLLSRVLVSESASFPCCLLCASSAFVRADHYNVSTVAYNNSGVLAKIWPLTVSNGARDIRIAREGCLAPMWLENYVLAEHSPLGCRLTGIQIRAPPT